VCTCTAPVLSLFSGVFDGKPADYLFLLIFNWICLVVSLYSRSELFVLVVNVLVLVG